MCSASQRLQPVDNTPALYMARWNLEEVKELESEITQQIVMRIRSPYMLFCTLFILWYSDLTMLHEPRHNYMGNAAVSSNITCLNWNHTSRWKYSRLIAIPRSNHLRYQEIASVNLFPLWHLTSIYAGYKGHPLSPFYETWIASDLSPHFAFNSLYLIQQMVILTSYNMFFSFMTQGPQS